MKRNASRARRTSQLVTGNGRNTPASNNPINSPSICRNTTAIAEEDGRVPAQCDQEVECEEDEERCLFDDLLPTPLFQRCENGIWSAELRTCDDDQDCRGFVDNGGTDG